MAGNIFGEYFKVVTFGESHGQALGAVIEGCPSGVPFNLDQLKSDLMLRRPGQNTLVSDRNEMDEPIVLSGIFEGVTLGTPIAIIVKNTDQKSSDYDFIKSSPRTGHADDLWREKYGHSDHRGGGRSSGRETLSRVIAGSIAKMFLNQLHPELNVTTFTSQVGPISLAKESIIRFFEDPDLKNKVITSPCRMPDKNLSDEVSALLQSAKKEGLSFGGTAQTHIEGLPNSLGQPVFKKIKSQLGSAVLSIGAVYGFNLGFGEETYSKEGSQFHKTNGPQYNGVRGGLTTGEPITFQTHFKPTSSVLDTAKKGRHDPCIVPRACSVIESMTYLVLADAVLARRLDQVGF